MTDNLIPENVEQHPWIDPEKTDTRVDLVGDFAFVWTIETDLMRRLLANPEVEPRPNLMDIEGGEIYSFYGRVPADEIEKSIESTEAVGR